jgi:hypothetical protein
VSQQNIDFGTFPDDPNADAIRTAFTKVQQNFTELYDFQRDLGVLSINRTPQPGITINSPTGNVLIRANISQVTMQTTSLGLGLNYPDELTAVTLQNSTQSIFVDLKANTTITTSLTVGSSPNVKITNSDVYANSGTVSALLLTGTLTTVAQPNVTSVGTLTSLAVTGNATAGNVYANSGTVGASLLTGTLTTAAQPNVTSVGTLTSLAVTGNATAGNVYANSGTVGASLLTGTLTTAAQPNVTSLGTLANLTVNGISNLGANSNVKITGGSNGQVLSTDGAGNLSWITAINSTVTNVVYVSKSGNDSNSGRNLAFAKLTIAAAVTVANALQTANPSGTTAIIVNAGDYTESNPMSLSAGVSIVGDNLRAVTVRPSNSTQDIFWVKSRCYITGITFRGHLSPAAAVAFPSAGAGNIFTSPYVQNCSSIVAKSLHVAGTFVVGVTYKIETIGTTDFTLIGAASNTVGVDFTATGVGSGDGTAYTVVGCGMRVDGDLAGGLKSMVLDAYTQFNEGGLGIHIINQGYAQLVSIFSICCIAGVKCEAGGTCSITNSNNSFGDYGLWADGVGPTLYQGTLISNTRSTLTVGGLSQRPAVNDAVEITDGVTTQYVLVRNATPLVFGESVITFAETLEFTPTPGTIDFKQISLITASGQTFEYVGTGTTLLTATPRLGGVPIQANEVRETNGGRVNFTSTDQFGDFRIGKGLTINEEAGVIEGTTFDKSLFAVLTPFILALEG